MPGATRNIRNYYYSNERRFSGANFAHQIAVVNPNNHEEMRMACRWLSEDSRYRTLVDINGNLYSTNGNRLGGENATLAQKIANHEMQMLPGQKKVRLLFVGKK
ncbi:hypothetical protein REG_0627 [Candidatus Regiella insecticola LSR1]|uniref:Uncharacterized protein n=1 Tax=Candidatus Regiella insecticola LSR1 TaxID=663321 RepID=E0WRM2_9ENTR|nr:hypothetical protein [Candidatus Regiella insecticola]EFL92782.1 hypothetical protein REG_0627 [Candidatus Regiella insecticola LSR1]